MSEEKIESAVTGRKATSTPAPFAKGAKDAAPGTPNSEGKEHQRRTAWPPAHRRGKSKEITTVIARVVSSAAI